MRIDSDGHSILRIEKLSATIFVRFSVDLNACNAS